MTRLTTDGQIRCDDCNCAYTTLVVFEPLRTNERGQRGTARLCDRHARSLENAPAVRVVSARRVSSSN